MKCVLFALLASRVLADVTSISDCHYHGDDYFCVDNEGNEGLVSPAPASTESSIPTEYSDCHNHATDVYCMYGSEEVLYEVEQYSEHGSLGEHDDTDGHADETHSESHSVSHTEDHHSEESGHDHDHEETGSHESEETGVITGCHFHGTEYFCLNEDGKEGYVTPAPASTAESIPTAYSGCHAHATETHCMDGSDEVQFVVEGDAHGEEEDDDDHDHESHNALTGCHFHGTNYFCVNEDGEEGYVTPAPASTAKSIPTAYSECHAHATETFCMDGSEEVQFVVETNAHGEDHDNEGDEEEMDCHFHAGVEHCVPKGGLEVENNEARVCTVEDRDYDIPLRIGLIFAMLATSALGSYTPLLLKKVFKVSTDGIVIMTFKQFGTGIIISTAFVHLLTHSQLMFANECLGNLGYEATAGAIAMAGIFIAFVIEYVCERMMRSRKAKLNQAEAINSSGDSEKNGKNIDNNSNSPSTSPSALEKTSTHLEDKVSVLLLEMGILFHSILIGITLVVAGDSYFITLFIVIVFHQFFEGLALGSRIAGLDGCNTITKLCMSGAFAIITPIGMAIGTGVLNQFNGNDPSTIIAIGTLDALSAGVLVWIGIMEMWAHDWIHGPLATAPLGKVLISFVALILGFVLMSVLGKWA